MESPESWFHRRATFYVEAQILFHLNQAGVLQLLSNGRAYTARQVADALKLDFHAVDALLDYVFEIDDLLERDDGLAYSLSEFGTKIVERFADSAPGANRRSINMFDVRVGAYGPVWQNIGRMLSGDGRYGQEFHREGRYAENGVSKLARNFMKPLTEQIDELGVDSACEIGLTTGLLERLGEKYPSLHLYGLDKSRAAVDRSAAAAAKLRNANWIHADFFDFDAWCGSIGRDQRGLIYSLHFHELMAHGEDKFIAALRELKRRLPGWVLLALEQPRLPHSERPAVPETLWLYAQSNILIHHLIGNGRILSRDEWVRLGEAAGCRSTERPCSYLGYQAFTFYF